ncbi:MAG: hypothetical protein M3Y62_04430 [Candidatus Dormibacteraeota bacterium]|nr:hypothetical protein [Candidatus Dormibacteraeota bacterium]
MEPTIVNPSPKWPPARLRDPLPFGYIHVAAAVQPPAQPGPPFPRPRARRKALLDRLKGLAADLMRLDEVEKATVYRAALVPPAGGGEPASHPARFDVAALIETSSPSEIAKVQAAEPYQQLLEAVQEVAQYVHLMAARCTRLLGDVDKSRPGLFLFNHFTTEEPQVALELWERLAGWYAVETGLDNSTLLQPIGEADYVFVNHARWDQSLPRLMLEQFARPSFRSYVLANLRANRTVSMPVLYRLA